MNQLVVVATAVSAMWIGLACNEPTDTARRSQSVNSAAEQPEEPIDAGLLSGAVQSLPVPSSPVVTSAVTPPAKTSAAARLQDKLAYLGAAKSRVIRATVDSIVVEKRTVPDALRWGAGQKIVSRMTLTPLETLCGVGASELQASFLGGTIDGLTQDDSKLSPRIEANGEYVLLLREEQGELWVQTRYDRLRVDGDKLYMGGESITKGEVSNLCP